MPRPNRTPNNPDLKRPYADVGQRIREFRIGQGLDASAFLGVYTSLVQISRVETGLRAPSIEMLHELRRMGADLNWIVTGE